jgi:DNA-binding MarR family transcriptional regulator
MSESASGHDLASELQVVVHRLSYALRQPGSALGLTPSRYAALSTLEKHGPMRASDFADALNISRPTMSKLTEGLLEGRWVTREADPTDRRAFLLALSEHGVDVLSRARAEAAHDLRTDLDGLDDAQGAALAAAMPVLVHLAESQAERQRRRKADRLAVREG